MKLTIQERVAAFLLAKGKVEVESRSRKYRQFTRGTNDDGTVTFYFLGRSGAIRAGRCASKTFDVQPHVWPNVLKWEAEANQ